MALSVGIRLGPYEIIGAIGAGGMGEVFRARDTKLGRDVALKILPDAFTHDADRVARFRREAQVLAALNHPNIAAIHGLEEANPSTGSGQAALQFLVLELVEGETLAQKLAGLRAEGKGPTVLEALAIARQIADALQAAHEKGIIHRDLKPANIACTADGEVKVLDFGLAKVVEPEMVPDVSHSPTLTFAATQAGVILGTAAYMSPEQARGRVADKRSDIWAFGCVLYEMLAGRRAFNGEDVADTLGDVLKTEPDWGALPASVPPSIRTLVKRCLEKDRRQRIADIAVARFLLDEPAIDGPVVPTARRRGERLAWTIAALAVVAAVTLAVPSLRAPADAPEMRLEINTPATSDPASFALSPDGKRLVFVAPSDRQERLWVRPLDGVSAQPLAGTEGASYPFWSPDSRSVGFFASAQLKRVDIGGALPEALTSVSGRRGATWSIDGVILFGLGGGPLFRVSASGGEPVAVTTVRSRQSEHRFPQFLPGGRKFLFYATGGTGSDGRGIYLGSLDGPETTLLTPADAAGLYVPAGWLLFIRQGTLVARRLDLARAVLTGDPVTVAESVSMDALTGAVSVSATGLIGYRVAAAGSRRQLTWLDRSGKPLGTLGAADENYLNNPALSPDGRRVAVERTVQNNTDIWLLDAARMTRFTFDPSSDTSPVWSPDGSRIAFKSDRKVKGINALYQKPSNGSGNEALLVESAQDEAATSWSADGRSLLYMSRDPKTTWDLWMLPLGGDRKPRMFLQTEFDERYGQFSPDGRWVAYRSNDQSGRVEIYVRPFPGPGGQWQVSTAGGIMPRWRRDGNELYYVDADRRLMAVPIAAAGGTLEPGMPVPLFQTRIVVNSLGDRPQYDVAPDGRFLINVVAGDASTSPITILLNWKPPAK